MKERIAEILLDINAVELRPDDPFTWSSGIVSPIYCDNRKVIGDVHARAEIADAFTELIQRYAPDVEVIAGTSTAGIPHAAYISERMDLPMCYVRGSRKKHGKGNQIEGADVSGRKVVVIEDLISTGGSSLEAVWALRENGAEVMGVFAIFTYGIKKAADAFEAAEAAFHTLSGLDALLDVSMEKGTLDESKRQTVIDFKNSL